MNNVPLEKIKSVIDDIFYNKESKYKKHQTIGLSIKTKKLTSKSKNMNSYVFVSPYKIKDNKDKKILFFGSKTLFEETTKNKLENIIYGNELEPKEIKSNVYKFCILQNHEYIAKHKTNLLKTGIIAKNQDSLSLEEYLKFNIAKYYK